MYLKMVSIDQREWVGVGGFFLFICSLPTCAGQQSFYEPLGVWLL
jgi:hypothetical protein